MSLMPLESVSDPQWFRLRGRYVSAEDMLRMFSVMSPPVPIDDIARGLGASLRYDAKLDREDLSGTLFGSDTPPPWALITVNPMEPPTRQRFTIAHEIGHLMLHPVGAQYRDPKEHYGPGASRIEAQANGYAAKLLMPEFMLRHLISVYGRDEARLAAAFDVSVAAMRTRLGRL